MLARIGIFRVPVAAVSILSILAIDGVAFAAPASNLAEQARVQTLIDSTAEGATFFRAEQDGSVIHLQSGMSCVGGSEKLFLSRLVITPRTIPGDDVFCDYVVPAGKVTQFAVRIGPRSFESYVSGVYATIARLYPEARPAGGVRALTYPGLSQPVGQAFAIMVEGKGYFTSVWIAQQRGWALEIRATYPVELRQDAELTSAGLMLLAQRTVQEYAGR